MNLLLRVILCMLCLVPALMSAQQIKVADFARLRKPFLRPRPYTVDKQFALLDLYTQEKGFEFLIGQQPVQVQEGDGMVTLMLPDMTAFFTIKHPDYGQLLWKVPDGPLHRKKRYHAQLLTDSPDKEFSIAHQWAVFRLQPAQAIVTIDSTMHRTLSGQIQVLLPVGSHSIRVEAPFHEELADTFVLSDTARLDMHINLHPLYSYLEVASEVPEAEIRLNGTPIGKGMARSGRISPGVHDLALYRGPLCIHRSSVTLASGERRILSVGGETAENRSGALSANDTLSAHDAATSLIAHDEQPDSFHIRAFDDSTEIWVNREKVEGPTGAWHICRKHAQGRHGVAYPICAGGRREPAASEDAHSIRLLWLAERIMQRGGRPGVAGRSAGRQDTMHIASHACFQTLCHEGRQGGIQNQGNNRFAKRQRHPRYKSKTEKEMTPQKTEV